VLPPVHRPYGASHLTTQHSISACRFAPLSRAAGDRRSCFPSEATLMPSRGMAAFTASPGFAIRNTWTRTSELAPSPGSSSNTSACSRPSQTAAHHSPPPLSPHLTRAWGSFYGTLTERITPHPHPHPVYDASHMPWTQQGKETPYTVPDASPSRSHTSSTASRGALPESGRFCYATSGTVSSA
jgi:hypothetical protein